MVRVAINGCGRIGKLILRAALQDEEIEIVAINDLTDINTIAHLIKYDSVHGTIKEDIIVKDKHLIIGDHKIQYYSQKDPHTLPWKQLKIDVVCECTGFFRTYEDAEFHIKAGAKKVLISAPAKGETKVKTIVKGVNDHTIKKEDKIISNGSCTTNCLAPIVHILHENYHIKHGLLNTVHSYTATQKLVDGPQKDLRRARAAAINFLPTTTGAAKTVTKVIPALEGKIDGMATRVPTPCGSLIDFTLTLEKGVSKDELNLLFRSVAQNELRGILEYTDKPIVSSDIVHNPHSVIYDSQATMVLSPTFVKIIAWYDNEWGFSKRMIDVLKIMGGC